MAKTIVETSMQQAVNDLQQPLIPLKEGTLVEVSILTKSRNKILVDVAGYTLGFIPEKEFSSDVSDLKAGDKVLAYILSVENDKGYTVLSLKKADKERFMGGIRQKFDNQEPISIRIKQANRGGLIAEYGSLEGFLPTSQLASIHYPKVGENKEKIIDKLNELIGKTLKVKILNYEEDTHKLIFSEKAAGDDQLTEKIKELKIGDKFEATVTGVVDFGIFVDVGKIEGLVHISEISWDKVSNLKKLYKPGDKVEVVIISIENDKVSFSMKKLMNDPWLEQVKDFQVNQLVIGKVIKTTPFGVFVQLKDGIKGLVHISELMEKIKDKQSTKIEDILNLGKEYEFKITEIDPDNHKINLVLTDNNQEISQTSKK